MTMKDMKVFNRNFVLLLIVLLFHMASEAKVKAPKKVLTPQILEVQGSVERQIPAAPNRPATIKAVTPKMTISDNLHLRLKPHSMVKVKLDEKRVLTAYGPGELIIPMISWEDRQFSEITLIQGILRLEIEDHPFPFTLKSSLFEQIPPVGETVFIYDPTRAFAEAWVVKGKMEFGALNADEVVMLKSGQKVTFQGYLEEGEIAYDLLLEGRKIPKGKLLSVQLIRNDELQSYTSKGEAKKRQALAAQNAKIQKREAQFNASILCQKPKGRFNECLWRRQNEGCYRLRCVADGQWKDRQRVSDSACSGNPKVAPCDY